MKEYVVICCRDGCPETATFMIRTKEGIEPKLELARFARDQGTQVALNHGVIHHEQGDWTGRCVNNFGHLGKVVERQ